MNLCCLDKVQANGRNQNHRSKPFEFLKKEHFSACCHEVNAGAGLGAEQSSLHGVRNALESGGNYPDFIKLGKKM